MENIDFSPERRDPYTLKRQAVQNLGRISNVANNLNSKPDYRQKPKTPLKNQDDSFSAALDKSTAEIKAHGKIQNPTEIDLEKHPEAASDEAARKAVWLKDRYRR